MAAVSTSIQPVPIGMQRRCLRALAALMLAVPCLAFAHGRGSIPPSAFQPTLDKGQFVADLQGTWNAPGLGYLFAIRGGGVEIYNRSGNLCWLDPWQSGPVSPDDQGPLSYFARPHAPFDAVFSATPENSFQVYVDRVGRMPAQCTRKEDRTRPLYVFDAIASTLAEFYPFGARRHVDWSARRAQFRPRAAAARNDEQLKSVLADFMAGFEDAHTLIVGDDFIIGRMAKPTMDRLQARYAHGEAPTPTADPDQTYAAFFPWYDVWREAQREQVYGLLDPVSRGQALEGEANTPALTWGVLEGNVGYLAVERMDDYVAGAGLAANRKQLAEILDRALGELQGTQALIVDVSNNSGGAGEIALDIASRFADRRRLALTLELPGLRRRPPQPYHIAPPPKERVRYAHPVYVLTSEATTSAGEWLALAMRTLPQAMLIGQSTQGTFTGDFVKGLPNGWKLTTSAAIGRDAYGVNYETRGVPPDVDLEVYADSTTTPSTTFDRGRAGAVSAIARAIAGD